MQSKRGLRICKMYLEEGAPVERAYVPSGHSRGAHMRTVHQMTIGKDRTPYFLAATAEQLSVIQDALEKNYYQPIRNELEKRFKEKFVAYYLEITDRGQFSDELKEQFPPTREIVFRFLKEAYPDIT